MEIILNQFPVSRRKAMRRPRFLVVAAIACGVVGAAPATASATPAAPANSCLAQFLTSVAGPGFGNVVAGETQELHPFGKVDVSVGAPLRCP
jgi:hypothetical protein